MTVPARLVLLPTAPAEPRRLAASLRLSERRGKDRITHTTFRKAAEGEIRRASAIGATPLKTLMPTAVMNATKT